MTMTGDTRDVQKVIEILEKKYPNHVFEWQEKAGRLWALCPNPQHNDTHPTNFNVYQGEDGKWHWKCFVCGISGPKKSDLDPIEGDIDILKNDLRRQIRERKGLGFKYLAERLDYLEEEQTQKLLFNVFEIGYHFYDPKFASDFSRIFKNSVSKVPVLWERSNYEWLVFPYRDLHSGVIDRLKFRNDTAGQKVVRIERVEKKEKKKKRNAIPVFGYENLHAQSPLLFLVEGEFDAITLTIASAGLYPAIALGGTGNFKKEVVEQIVKKAKGKAIVVLPDWDTAGREALYSLIGALNNKFLENNKLFTILKPPTENVKDIDEYLRDKYDYADDAMVDLFENAVSLIEVKNEIKKEREKEQEKKLKEYPIVVQSLIHDNYISNIDEEFEDAGLKSVDEDINKKEAVLRGLRKGEVGFLVSKGETGKSFFSLYLSILLASKIKNLTDPFILLSNQKENFRRVLYLNYEDPADILREREKDIISKIAESFAGQYTKEEIFNSCKDNLIIKRPAKSKVFDLFKEEQNNLIVNQTNFKKIEILIKQYAVDLLIIDTWSKIAYLNENSNHTVSYALAELQNFASELDIAILVLHHTSKSANLNGLVGTDALRGATALYNNVRYIIQMQKTYKKGNEKEIKKELQKFGNDELVDFYMNKLDEHEKKNAILVYESKYNFGNKIAYIYVRDTRNGTLLLAHEEPFEIYI